MEVPSTTSHPAPPLPADAGAAPYEALILRAAPRLLSMVDRQPMSPTAGCCDRTFWGWKFVDFPRSRFQETVCVLADLFRTPRSVDRASGIVSNHGPCDSLGFDGSALCGNERLLSWIEDALRYWTTLQHGDGSFDEAYPYERSLAATSFTGFYVGEAVETLGDALSDSVRGQVSATMHRLGVWLDRNDEWHGFLSNHLAAAAGALYHAYRVTGDARFERRSRHFLDRILRHQSDEGWYEEYGGADPGYQTHGTFYLARYWQLSQDAELLGSLRRSTRFLAHFVHPDGSIGGEYASRNTKTHYPAAFEMLAPVDPSSAWIAQHQRTAVQSGAAAGLGGIDSYNFLPFLNNMVFADRAARQNEATPPEREAPSDDELVWFPDAGLARVRKPAYDAFVGTSKGGVLMAFDREADGTDRAIDTDGGPGSSARTNGRLIRSDAGYVGRMRDGAVVSNQNLDRARGAEVSAGRIQVQSDFCQVTRPTMRPWSFVAFRLTTLTMGLLPRLSRAIKQLLVKVLVYRKHPVGLHCTRTIEFDEHEVRVVDEIRGADGGRLERLEARSHFTTIHMGSSGYFIPHELGGAATDDARPVDLSRIADGVTQRLTIPVEGR